MPKSQKQSQSKNQKKPKSRKPRTAEEKRQAKRKLYLQDPEKVKVAVKELYFQYNLSRHDVIELSGAPAPHIDSWLYGEIDKTIGRRPNNGWYSEREKLQGEILETVVKANEKSLNRIVDMGTSIIIKTLENLHMKTEAVTVREAKEVGDIVKNIDKIMKLNDGKPTDIKKSVRITQDKLKSKLDRLAEVDPYGAYSKEEEGDDKDDQVH